MEPSLKLKRLLIENFQAHKRLEILFSPTITTIIGPTDVGKSAIIRALRWLVLNDMPGTDFLREGAKEVRVSLTVEVNGQRYTIRRTRKTRTNTYHLNDKQYEAFGLGIPQDIAQLLRTTEINFQSQYDPPFWFTISAGQVSRQLNAVIDLDIIDTSLSKVSARIRDLQSRIGLLQEETAKDKEALEQTRDTKQRSADFTALSAAHLHKEQLVESIASLKTAIHEIQNNQSVVLAKKAQEVRKVLALAQSWRAMNEDYTHLTAIIQQIKEESSKSKPPPSTQAVREAYAKWSELNKTCTRLEQLSGEIRSLQSRVDNAKKTYAQKHEELERRTKGEKCPLCGNLFP